MKNSLHKLTPFIIFGIMIFIFIAGLVILSYILIFGALIGLVLFVAQWLRDKLISRKSSTLPTKTERKGRIIDHDES
jgi:hypothetical protein